jgi:Tol biopolymer transport system component
MDANGANQQEIVLPTRACEHVWSPDGKLIAYYSYPLAGTTGIWLLNSDGTNARPLTPNCSPLGECTGFRRHYRPRWFRMEGDWPGSPSPSARPAWCTSTTWTPG